MTEDLDTQIRQFIDGELPPADEQDALHRIADDEEARHLLRFELQVRADWNPGSAPEVPAGFADRTMAAIETETTAAPSSSRVVQQLRRLGRWLTTPQPVALRPALGLAVVMVLVVAIGLLPFDRFDSGSTPTSSSVTRVAADAQGERQVVWTRFMYANDEASSVAVAGDFSGWEPVSLTAQSVNGRTVWTGLVPVPKGEHQYMFVIDGSKWVTDPLAPIQRDDGFGHKNAVLRL